jgi:hypothetical protein
MNADEVRNARLRETGAPVSYDAAEVDDLLNRAAVELDAGRPAGPLITNATLGLRGRGSCGLELQAVDWFLDQMRRREDPTEQARLNADPWRDLAVVNHFTGPGPVTWPSAWPRRRGMYSGNHWPGPRSSEGRT